MFIGQPIFQSQEVLPPHFCFQAGFKIRQEKHLSKFCDVLFQYFPNIFLICQLMPFLMCVCSLVFPFPLDYPNIFVAEQVLGLPQSIEMDQRPDKKFRQGFIGAAAEVARSESKKQVPLLTHSLSGGGKKEVGGSLFVTWGEGRNVSTGGQRGGEYPLGGTMCKDVCTGPLLCSKHPIFAPGSLKVATGFSYFLFGLFVSFVQNLSHCACTQLFSVPYNSFVFCCMKRGVAQYRHCSAATKGARCQTCLNSSLSWRRWLFSRSVVSDSFDPMNCSMARLPCPSPSP